MIDTIFSCGLPLDRRDKKGNSVVHLILLNYFKRAEEYNHALDLLIHRK